MNAGTDRSPVRTSALGCILRGTVGFVLAAFVVWAVVLVAIFSYGRRDFARPADAIVVLGAAQYDGRPSPVLRARMDHAIHLFRQGTAPVLITTGGVGVGDTVSEAVVARRYAIRHGVPEDAILFELGGLRTRESMHAVADLMNDRGLRSAVFVSDPFHLLRVRLLALRLGIRGATSPTRTSPISDDRRREWRFIVRESGIILLMLIPGDF